MEIPDDGGQPLEIYVLAENTRPAIAFVEPSGTQSDGYIQWHDHDPDDNAQINLYFDSDDKDFDGVLINPTPISENSSTDTYTWDMLNVDPGDYYIYGVIADTNNAPYAVYAPGKIHIPNLLGPAPPGDLIPVLTDSSIQLSWTPSPDIDIWGYTVHFTDDTSSVTYDQHWSVGDTIGTELRPVPPDTLTGGGAVELPTGRYYKLAVSCFDSLFNVSDLSDPVTVFLVNNSGNNPPVIDKTGIPTMAQEGKLYTYDLSAFDADGHSIAWILLEEPGFDVNVDIVTWTPDSTDVGMYFVQILAIDGFGGEDTLGYTLHVVEADRSYGNVQWGSPVYGGTEGPGFIVLQDFDLDILEHEIDSTAVFVESDTDPAGTTVWVRQLGPSSLDFIGTVSFSTVSSGPGVLQVSDGDQIKVSYADDNPPDEVVAYATWLEAMSPDYICGDANGDGVANITDAVYLITYIFGGGPPPDPLESGDANCDGTVNITDAVYLITYIFGGGGAPCDPDNDGEPEC